MINNIKYPQPVLQKKPINYREAVTIDSTKGLVVVNEDMLDIYRKPQLELEEWKPDIQIKEYQDAMKLYLDIETVGGLDPENARVISIGLLFHNSLGEKTIILTNKDEKIILQELVDKLKEHKKKIDLLVGHNVHNFDIPFLAKRCEINDIAHPFKKANKPTRITASSFNGAPLQITQWYCDGIDIVDTFILACIYDKAAATLPNYRLKDVAIALGVRDERRLELDFKEIAILWENNDIKPIEEYLEYDLIDTKGLADNFIPVVWYQRKIVPGLSLQQLVVASPSLKWQKILESFYPYKYRMSIYPVDKLKYEGALTGCNPGLYKDCYKIDVSSMYPSIMMRYEIASEKDINHGMLRVLKYLFTERFNLKAKYKETGNESFNHQQGSLKILLNSAYGYLGVGGYSFNDMTAAALVTAFGRIILLLMQQTIEEAGGYVVEIDTDGLICCNGDPEDVTQKVRDALPDGIGVDLDFTHCHVYVPKRKSYILFQDSGKGKIKKVGLFRKRNRTKLEREFVVNFLKCYLDSPQEAKDYYQQIARSIITRTIDLELLKITQKIPKNDKSLTNAGIGEHGDKVTYYFAENVRISEKTGKKLKSSKKPVLEGNYWIDHYLGVLNKIYTELIETIEKKPPILIEN